ncbi:M1 family metallopeptidase [Jatrophihabitans sp. YIM 134969]
MVNRRNVGVVLTSCALLTVSLVSGVAGAAPVRGTPGAAGAGDGYFPRQGNGGYDVAHYDLAVSYTPESRALTGVTKIRATATQALSRFDLDLRRTMVVSRVVVDGRPATFTQRAAAVQELVVTPATTLRAGTAFTVQVTYGGTAAAIHDPDGALDGFIPTPDGAFVASEPQGAPTWFPCNDTPRDKATYTLAVTTPSTVVAVGNGTRLSSTTGGGRTTSVWSMAYPIPTYLVTATIGEFDVTTGRTPGGVPYLNAVTSNQAAGSAAAIAALPDVVDWFSKKFGPYPFDSVGAIVDDAPDVGYALETATRPVFDRAPDVATMSHELAHQWFGDDVTLGRWRDIWLNEGFAEFASWLYGEHTGGPSTHDRLERVLARPADDSVWTPPPANPGGPENIFADSVYTRGAATLAALRDELGDATFFDILKRWVAGHAYGSASVTQFRQFAAKVSGRDLTRFFAVWLDDPAKPTSW